MSKNYVGPGRYQHYKGGEYMVLGLALQEDSIDKSLADPKGITFVIYQPLTHGSILEGRPEEFWARELGDFNEMVRVPTGQGSAPGETGEPGNSYVPRFQFVGSVAI